jgi:two-component system response regulator YesN
VLIVDDDKLARKGLMSIMPWQKWGMTVVGEAPNGLKALEFLTREPADLMFVDLSMPVMSGIELMQQTRQLYPALQFVVLTFHEDFDYVQTCIRLGALDYISKLKMETEDYNSIFERIAQRMGHPGSSGVSPTTSAAGNTPPDARNASPDARNALSSPLPATRVGQAETDPDGAGAAAAFGGSEAIHAGTAAAFDVSGTTDAGTVTEEDLSKRWLDLTWLFDDLVFNRLCEDTLVHPQPETQAIALLSRALAGAEALTHIPVPAEAVMTSLGSAIQSVRTYRDQVESHAARTDDLSVTAICMLKCARYIRENMTDPLHTDDVATHVNMSRSYFCQCFKRQVGQTFNEYVRYRRIHLAREYLLKTQQPISWIAQAVGYADLKYFSRVFREQEGMLPSEFRAAHGHAAR